MDFEEIRRVAITALFSDDVLLEKLVLKGGNALRLVYAISSRSSLDLDVSIEEDFENLEDIKKRLFAALIRRFEDSGLVAFDLTFDPKPSAPEEGNRWGGYQVGFKLIERKKYGELGGNQEKLRRNAVVLGPMHQRKFTIDISKYEYCENKREMELDGFTIYVYTPTMIAIKKLRALCQQMDGYPRQKHARVRAKDFYDIHLVLTQEKIDLSSPKCRELIAVVFAAKEVPLHFLGRIESQREFHRPDWPGVQASVFGPLEAYDFYFDFVMGQVKRLQTLWIK